MSVCAWLPTADLSWWSNLVTVVGLPIALFGLFTVARQMKNDRLAVSAGAIGDMRSNIMARVERIQRAQEAEDTKLWDDEFTEFENDLEMACAIYLDGQMSGRSGELARRMICDLLEIINADDDMRKHLEDAIHSKDTFRNIRDFRKKVKA